MKINQAKITYNADVSCHICGNRFNAFDTVQIPASNKMFTSMPKQFVCCDHQYEVRASMQLTITCEKIEKPKETEYVKDAFYKVKNHSYDEISIFWYGGENKWYGMGEDTEFKTGDFAWIDSEPLDLGA